MNRIYVSRYGVEIESGQSRKPIPPGKVYTFHEQPVTMATRLYSTRGGANAWWRAGEQAAECLNEAPFQPFVRALVSQFMWWPPRTRDTIYTLQPLRIYPVPEDVIVQGGSGVLNWQATVVGKIPDPFRDTLAEFVNSTIVYNYKQGHLEVAEILLTEGGASQKGLGALPQHVYETLIQVINHTMLAGSGYRMLYNHYFYKVALWSWRVIGGVAYAVFRNSSMSDMIITSAEHDDEPIVIRSKNSVFLARHPVPIGGRD